MWWSGGAIMTTPARSGIPSVGCSAGRRPARLRMLGRKLGFDGATCSTTSTAEGKSSGRASTMRSSAPTPPAEAPITTMSHGGRCVWHGVFHYPVGERTRHAGRGRDRCRRGAALDPPGRSAGTGGELPDAAVGARKCCHAMPPPRSMPPISGMPASSSSRRPASMSSIWNPTTGPVVKCRWAGSSAVMTSTVSPSAVVRATMPRLGVDPRASRGATRGSRPSRRRARCGCQPR